MDFTHRPPPPQPHQLPPPLPQQPPHPQRPAIQQPYPPPLLPMPSHSRNPSPNTCVPHGGSAVRPAAVAGENTGAVGGLAAYYYERIGLDPVGFGQIPQRPLSGLDPAVPSHAATPQWGAKSNNNNNQMKVVKSTYCGVCEKEFTTQEDLSGHKQVEEHIKKLVRLQAMLTPKPRVPKDATNKKPRKRKSKGKKGEKKRKHAPEKDLERKKMKVLEGGAEPSQMMVCTICDVVANSQKVFDSHIAGSKHAGNVKKQQEAAAAT